MAFEQLHDDGLIAEVITIDLALINTAVDRLLERIRLGQNCFKTMALLTRQVPVKAVERPGTVHCNSFGCSPVVHPLMR